MDWEPYADGTSGHSGDASLDAEPQRRRNIDRAMRLVRRAGRQGITWRELAERTGWHHGQASGALSNLHRSGLAVRLAERRHRCGVYVAPEHVQGREQRPYGRKRRPPALADLRPADPGPCTVHTCHYCGEEWEG